MGDSRIRDFQRRTRRYWLEDGIVEVGLGVILLLWGAVLVLPPAQRDSWAGATLIVGGIAAVLGSRRVVRRIKARTTFPRTGYAVPGLVPRGQEWVVALAILVAVVGLFWAGAAANGTSWARLESLSTPAVLAGGFVALAVWLGIRRLVIVGVVGLLSAAGFYRAGLTGDGLAGTSEIVLGCALVTSGALAFAAYRRRNLPPPEA